jgi:mono/diheme cytochrome c family protein
MLEELSLRRVFLMMIVVAGFITGCQQEMAEQPAYRPLEDSSFFADGRSARPLPAGVVPRGPLQVADPLYSGLSDRPGGPAAAVALLGLGSATPVTVAGAIDAASQSATVEEYSSALPFPLTEEVLLRGQERFDIFCAVCHGFEGKGNGKIVQRGYTRAPNYVTDLSGGFEHRGIRIRLRDVPIGYFFEVISKGYGAMPDYESQVPPQDRWAIAAYVRALQISQYLRLGDLPEEERAKILSQLQEPEDERADGKAQGANAPRAGKAPGGAP